MAISTKWESDKSKIVALLSRERVSTYLSPTENALAIKKYKANSEVSAIFYELLGHLEVPLRNAIVLNWNQYLNHACAGSSCEWPLDLDNLKIVCKPRMVNLFNHEKEIIKALDKSDRYLRSKRLPRKSTNGDLVSNLNFGFWRFCFTPSFDFINEAKFLRMFPNYPHSGNVKKDLADVKSRLIIAYNIRNRIAHHEPIFNSPSLVSDFHAICELIGFIGVEYKGLFLEKKLSSFLVRISTIP